MDHLQADRSSFKERLHQGGEHWAVLAIDYIETCTNSHEISIRATTFQEIVNVFKIELLVYIKAATMSS